MKGYGTRVAEDPNRPGFVDAERLEQYLLSVEGKVAGGVREHHPEMADAREIKGARPLKPLDGPRYIRDGNGDMFADWWLQTDDSIHGEGKPMRLDSLGWAARATPRPR